MGFSFKVRVRTVEGQDLQDAPLQIAEKAVKGGCPIVFGECKRIGKIVKRTGGGATVEYNTLNYIINTFEMSEKCKDYLNTMTEKRLIKVKKYQTAALFTASLGSMAQKRKMGARQSVFYDKRQMGAMKALPKPWELKPKVVGPPQTVPKVADAPQTVPKVLVAGPPQTVPRSRPSSGSTRSRPSSGSPRSRPSSGSRRSRPSSENKWSRLSSGTPRSRPSSGTHKVADKPKVSPKIEKSKAAKPSVTPAPLIAPAIVLQSAPAITPAIVLKLAPDVKAKKVSKRSRKAVFGKMRGGLRAYGAFKVYLKSKKTRGNAVKRRPKKKKAARKPMALTRMKSVPLALRWTKGKLVTNRQRSRSVACKVDTGCAKGSKKKSRAKALIYRRRKVNRKMPKKSKK